LKRYKSPGSDQIPAEMIQAGGKTLLPEIHKVINSIWNKEELPDQCSPLLYQYTKNGDKSDCSNHRGILLLSTSYKMLSNILLSSLRSTTGQIFCIRQILVTKMGVP
jgi:hypothetical protein